MEKKYTDTEKVDCSNLGLLTSARIQLPHPHCQKLSKNDTLYSLGIYIIIDHHYP